MIPKNNQQLEDQKKKFIKTYSECKLPISPLHYIIKKKKKLECSIWYLVMFYFKVNNKVFLID